MFTQKDQLIQLFRDNHYVLTLGQIMKTNLAAEYRARMSDLRRDGFMIVLTERHPEAPSQNIYRLEEPIQYRVEADGQAAFA